MKRNIKITLIVCLLWVLLVLVVTFYRYSGNNAAEASQEELREIGAMVYEEPVAFEPFSLVDHHGEPFTEQTLEGKWSLIFFGFTNCPDICPLTMNELTGFYRDLAAGPYQADTQVVMISVDPFRDDTAQIAQYMEAYHEDFLGVNGEYSEVSRLARDLYISHGVMPVPTQDGSDSTEFMVDHSGNILLIDPQGQYRGFLEPNIRRANILEAYQIIRQTI